MGIWTEVILWLTTVLTGIPSADALARYFKSWFHCFDATVILVGFVIDVCLKNVLEEAGSIVIVLRLWRYAVIFGFCCLLRKFREALQHVFGVWALSMLFVS